MRIERQGQKKYRLINIESKNSTLLNGKEITKPTIIKSGAKVKIGGTTLKVDLADTYGLFKFADILSANNLTDYKISKPNKNVKELEVWLNEKIKNKGIGTRKDVLRTQLNLSKIDTNCSYEKCNCTKYFVKQFFRYQRLRR